LDLSKKIIDLNLPYLDVVLEDIFFISADPALRSAPTPVTIYDLAEACARPGELVWQKLHAVQKLSRGIVLDPVSCRTVIRSEVTEFRSPLLFDVRFLESVQNDDISNAYHLPTMTTEEWQALYPKEKSAVVFSEDGRKAFSAAMWLREQGRLNTYCIKLQELRSALFIFCLCFLTRVVETDITFAI